jgi:molecular chaperone DnaK
MSADNKTLGRFELVGIPPAPRGIPQIEVTFDIDANGIVNVSAKDLGTSKQQSIKITASSGLSESEIQQMVRDAEEHASEDKQRREAVEARNQLDGLIYSTEKSLADHGAALETADRVKIEEAIAEAKRQLEKNSTAEELKKTFQALSQESHKIAEQMYKKASSGSASGGGDGRSSAANGQAGESGRGPGGDEGVVDADFEEVK